MEASNSLPGPPDSTLSPQVQHQLQHHQQQQAPQVQSPQQYQHQHQHQHQQHPNSLPLQYQQQQQQRSTSLQNFRCNHKDLTRCALQQHNCCACMDTRPHMSF